MRIITAVLALALCLIPLAESRLFAFVANSTHIVTYDSSPEGRLTFLSIHYNPSPSAWLSVWPTYNPTSLLATGEAQDGNGTVVLYSINRDNGVLYRRGVHNSSGLNPAYVSWDVRGRYALVANYGAGDNNSTGASLSTISIDVVNGVPEFNQTVSVVKHNGSSVNPDRQTGPHPHMITVDYTNDFVFSPDLGVDKVYQYNFAANGSLSDNAVPFVIPAVNGDGPRHIAFHPDRLFAYVINEMGNSVDVWTYDAAKGDLDSLVQTVSTLPQGYNGTSEAAEIVVSPDGRFLYASNRGYDSIVGYYINPLSTDFHLKVIGWQTHRISTPRNFAIDNTGTLMLVGCSTTNEIVAFRIQNDGFLAPTGEVTSIAGAISIVLSRQG
jgi:6-phosphogluconolactonase